MSQSENILSELKNISVLVAGIGSTNVYDLPEGYFINLSEEISERITVLPLQELREQTSQLYAAPEGYFENFSSNLLTRIQAEEETNPRKEITRLSPLLSEISIRPPFHTPDNYFTELAGDVVSGAQAIDFVNQELEIEASLLHQLDRKNVYSVPPGYFFKFPHELLQKVKGKSVAKSLSGTYRKVLGMMAAAIVTGIIFIGAWSYMGRSGGQKYNPDLANVEAREISNYLESLPAIPSDTTLSAGASLVNTVIEDGSNKEIKQLLAGVSNAELEKYIEMHSVSKDLMTE